MNQLSTSDMILDPTFTAKETCPQHQHNDILVQISGVPLQITATLRHTYCVTASEILQMYIITLSQTHFNITIQSYRMKNSLENLLPFSLP